MKIVINAFALCCLLLSACGGSAGFTCDLKDSQNVCAEYAGNKVENLKSACGGKVIDGHACPESGRVAVCKHEENGLIAWTYTYTGSKSSIDAACTRNTGKVCSTAGHDNACN